MTFFLLTLLTLSFAIERKPVILVPGLMSTILESKIGVDDNYQPFPQKCSRHKDWFRSWVSVRDTISFTDDCYLWYLHGVWNPITNKLENIPGISIRVPQFGNTYAIDTLCPIPIVKRLTHAFHGLIQHLKKQGYVELFDLFGAGYDWRSNDVSDQYLKSVKDFIVSGYENTKRKVVIISHSMGAFITYKLLDYLGKEFCDTYIDKWIPLSAPFLGSGLAIKELLVGENIGLPINEKLARDLARSIQSIISLSPNPDFWSNEPLIIFKKSGKQFFAKDLVDAYNLVDEMKDKAEYILTNSIRAYYEKYNWTIPFGVETHCGYSLGYETPYRIEFEGDSFDSKYTVIFSSGDKLVNEESLKACSLFTQNVTFLGKYKHLKLLEAQKLYEFIDPLIH
ncbi:1-O-acylceramide synthase precursor, putative [Entamoeba dispar SAW760]|uniref:1-O-acylceramide synthase, putative n=1 Tax=Entamoeba dispar (strain ATCC PRA-260 / SAW760) TaxID=370354 RepID=B0EPP8_ENTDS|nr:1-O-acylceramide synthase precursor, putative [Entamoeba dispar SAW760]EDR23478.1 1-O-acylceramide synthase precursor, putative [Entamoeba dispar SAW760]|eukprot:EDR23478.1 1-O-acylceramide synthase precursor, putative [Entamoeba dispar SAW760]